jgi:hypothetical protein
MRLITITATYEDGTVLDSKQIEIVRPVVNRIALVLVEQDRGCVQSIDDLYIGLEPQ